MRLRSVSREWKGRTVARRYEIDPNQIQKEKLHIACRAHRAVYNWTNEQCLKAYEHGEKIPNKGALSREFTKVQHLNPRLFCTNDVSNINVRRAIEEAVDSWHKFFRDRKQGRVRGFKGNGKPKGIPLFKSWRDRQSFYVHNQTLEAVDGESCVRIQKIGSLRLKHKLTNLGKIRNARVSEEAGRWFISITYGVRSEKKEMPTGPPIGVDVNANAFVLSDGTFIKTPRPLRHANRRMKRLHRKVSAARGEHYVVRLGKSKGVEREHLRSISVLFILANAVRPNVVSNRHRVRVEKLGAAHWRVKQQRKGWMDKTTTELMRKHSVIVIEDLNVKGLQMSSRSSRFIHDVAPGMFRTMLLQKQSRFGCEIILVDPAFTSQICNNCKSKQKLPLSVRTYKCPMCGFEIHRDYNAALNILERGIDGDHSHRCACRRCVTTADPALKGKRKTARGNGKVQTSAMVSVSCDEPRSRETDTTNQIRNQRTARSVGRRVGFADSIPTDGIYVTVSSVTSISERDEKLESVNNEVYTLAIATQTGRGIE